VHTQEFFPLDIYIYGQFVKKRMFGSDINDL